MSLLNPKERLIVALDVGSKNEVASICDAIGGNAIFYKIGLELFLAEGRGVVEFIKSRGAKVFLDLKLHDIPNQVAGACREIVKMGVDMTTVHTMGGLDMLQQVTASVKQASAEYGTRPPILLGVTILTSLNQERAGEIGLKSSITEQVVNLARLAKKSGLDGVVASPQEVEDVRKVVGEDFIIVTPGIRSSTDEVHDQKRVMSAYNAVRAGSSYLVVGRPIIKAGNPANSAAEIVAEIEKAGEFI